VRVLCGTPFPSNFTFKRLKILNNDLAIALNLDRCHFSGILNFGAADILRFRL
jgi:hypothetical protein